MSMMLPLARTVLRAFGKDEWFITYTDGGYTLERVAEVMNITRERTRQIQDAAILKILRQPMVRALEEHYETGADS
jgi:DNA-directed RNA polymerase sigma subunit (sigma70/sigma32)